MPAETRFYFLSRRSSNMVDTAGELFFRANDPRKRRVKKSASYLSFCVLSIDPQLQKPRRQYRLSELKTSLLVCWYKGEGKQATVNALDLRRGRSFRTARVSARAKERMSCHPLHSSSRSNHASLQSPHLFSDCSRATVI